MTTAKALAADQNRVALIRNHGTDQERCVQTLSGVSAINDTARQTAVRRARANYPDEPLVWLSHFDRSVTKVPTA